MKQVWHPYEKKRKQVVKPMDKFLIAMVIAVALAGAFYYLLTYRFPQENRCDMPAPAIIGKCDSFQSGFYYDKTERKCKQVSGYGCKTTSEMPFQNYVECVSKCKAAK